MNWPDWEINGETNIQKSLLKYNHTVSPVLCLIRSYLECWCQSVLKMKTKNMKVIILSFVCTIDFGKLFSCQSVSKQCIRFVGCFCFRKCRLCWHSTDCCISRNKWLACNGKKYYRTSKKSNFILISVWLPQKGRYLILEKRFYVFICLGSSWSLDFFSFYI